MNKIQLHVIIVLQSDKSYVLGSIYTKYKHECGDNQCNDASNSVLIEKEIHCFQWEQCR